MIGGALRSTAGGGGGGGQAPAPTPAARYLHDMTLTLQANGAQVAASSMQSNGFQVQLTDGTGATGLDLSIAPAWSAPLPADLLGNATAILNLGQRVARWAILERAVSALPMSLGVMVGFCEGANPVDGAGQGIGIGLEWASGTLRLTSSWRRNDTTGVWTRVAAGAGQSTCFGAETTSNPHGLVSVDDMKTIPLDSNFDHGTVGSNTAAMGTVVAANLLDHVCVVVYRTGAAAGTPTVRFDAAFEIYPDLSHV